MPRLTKKHAVDRTRLTWVLAILVASMTIGTVVLGMLESDRALSAEARYLAATYNSVGTDEISKTRTPISSEIWNAIGIARVGSDMQLPGMGTNRTDNAPLAHFVVSPQAEVLVTVQWVNQLAVENYPGTIQIGIQLAPGQRYASVDQAKTVVLLLRDLQARCDIGTANISLRAQQSGHSGSKDPLARFKWRRHLLR